MGFRYRIRGKVESPFILRGIHFTIGSDIDLIIYKHELCFVKERCQINELIDLAPPTTILKETTIKNKEEPKEVENELPKQTGGTNKSKYKRKV